MLNLGSTVNLKALDLAQLILDLRGDLSHQFSLDTQPDRLKFAEWLLLAGIKEYRALGELPVFKAWLNQPSPIPGLSLMQDLLWSARPDVQKFYPRPHATTGYLDWFFRHGVGEHALWPVLTQIDRHRACLQDGPWQSLLSQLDSSEHEQIPIQRATQQQLGVNLVGYVHGQLGIGEDVRMAAIACDAVGLKTAMVNFPPGHDVPQNDMSLADRVVDRGPYPINIFCLTALEHGRFYAERGATQLEEHYNIGYWPWELSQWPKEWRQLVHLVDEVWVSTRHTMAAVQPYCSALQPPIPVKWMPMAVPVQIRQKSTKELENQRQVTRKNRELPLSACLFCFSFDLNSSIHRKDPEAALNAFLMAFPLEKFGPEEVGLVLKVHPPKTPHRAWSALKSLAKQDKRLHIIEETLPRAELLSLYQACDCFVSLHRAEGFGRGIAEALQLGLRLIVTDYSGNVDFCRLAEFSNRIKRIQYRLVKVGTGQYPYAENQVWARANKRTAAMAMVEVFAEVKTSKGKLMAVPEGGWPMFSPEQVGRRYLERLNEIRTQRHLI